MEYKKRGFFERLTGTMNMKEEYEEPKKIQVRESRENKNDKKNWVEEESDEAELAVDLYQTPTDIVIQTFVAGVKPEDLELSVARDMVTIAGKREESRNIDDENYFTKELYWGRFSRTISLPQEVEPEEVEATERHGLLTIKIQKIDKEKRNNVRIKSI